MLALQGPLALQVFEQALEEGEIPARFRHTSAIVAGASALVCRTGYTGEDGVELLIDPADARAVWDGLTRAGATPAFRPTIHRRRCPSSSGPCRASFPRQS